MAHPFRVRCRTYPQEAVVKVFQALSVRDIGCLAFIRLLVPPAGDPRGRCADSHLAQDADGLGHFGFEFVGGIGFEAVGHVAVNEVFGDAIERGLDGHDLRQDLVTWALFSHHALNALDLAFDAPQVLDDGLVTHVRLSS